MKASPTSWFGDAATVAIGYSATTLMSAGMSTLSAASPAAMTSVTYTIPASASPAVTLVTTPRTFCSRLAGVTVDARGGEDLLGVVAAGHLLGADHA